MPRLLPLGNLASPALLLDYQGTIIGGLSPLKWRPLRFAKDQLWYLQNQIYPPSLKTHSKFAPENRPFAPKGSRIVFVTIHSQGRKCEFQGGRVIFLLETSPVDDNHSKVPNKLDLLPFLLDLSSCEVQLMDFLDSKIPSSSQPFPSAFKQSDYLNPPSLHYKVGPKNQLEVGCLFDSIYFGVK